MDSKVKSIDEHLYNPARTERQYVVTSAKRLAPRTSLRYRLSKLNQPGGMFNLSGGQFNPHMKVWAIIFLIVGSIVTAGVLAQGPLFHSQGPSPNQNGNDPYTNIWKPTNSSGLFQHKLGVLAQYLTGANCSDNPQSCESLMSNSTTTALVLTNDPVGELSLASGKNLVIHSFYQWCCGPAGTNPQSAFGWYLTTNGTVPTHDIGSSAAYNPADDPSVAMIAEVQPSGPTHHGGLVLFIQKPTSPQISISKQDHGCLSGSAFLCGPQNAIGYITAGHSYIIQAALNWTGSGSATGTNTCNGSGFGPACSFVDSGDFDSGNDTITTGVILPQTLESGSYYFGFFELPQTSLRELQLPYQAGGSSAACGFFSPCITYWNPSPNTPSPIDTGGFFGPIIRALIGIGIFILQNILSFASFLWQVLQPVFTVIITLLISILASIAAIVITVIKAVLNAIGTGLGISALGDNLFTFLGDIAAFFTTFFGNSLAQLSSFITFLTNGYSTISASFGTYWTDVTNWTSGIKDLLAGLWIIGGQLFSVSFALMFSGWLLFGAKKFSDSVGEGMEWFNLTRQFVMIGVALALFLFTMILHYVIIPVFHAVTATGEAKQTAEPDVVIGGTGVG